MELNENVIRAKSYDFAVRTVFLFRKLKAAKVEIVLLHQLLKCGTSIAANVEEAVGAISKAEFSSKISISYKEARETMFWLRLLRDTGSLSEKEYLPMASLCDEILRILYAILKKTRIKPEQ